MPEPDTQAVVASDPVTTADTSQTQPSEASEQVNDAPQATQGTAEVKETEATEVKATDTAEEKLYAGKYKTVEDMEKAYQELNSKFSQTTSEKAELSRILNEAFTNPEVNLPTASPAGDDLDDYSDESFSNPLNQEIENLKRVTAVQSFIMNHQDADPAVMQKVLAEDPLVKQISGHDAKLEYAYLRSQNMAKDKAIAEAQKSGQQAAQAKLAEKQVAQVETAGQTAAVTDEKSELQQRMASGTLADREVARREYIKKYLV